MPTVALVTPFAEWLDAELRTRGLRRSQLAGYMGKPQSTVSSWFNDDRIPRPELCLEIARVLHISADEVMRRAGHLPPLAEEREPYDAMPDWARLLPGLSKHDAEYVGRLVESMVQKPVVPDEPPDQGAPQ